MTHSQEQAIKRLVQKRVDRSLPVDDILDYIIGKMIDTNSKKEKLMWIGEFDLIFNSLPKRHQEILAYGDNLGVPQ